MDVVYKIGKQCEWDGYEELRYSIRSLVENFKELDQIYIVGYLPDWVDKRLVRFIECKDPYLSNKDANLINKLVLASNQEEISAYFLNMSDDMFFLKETDDLYFLGYPRYNNNLIRGKTTALGDMHYTKWEKRLMKTIDVLEKNNKRTNLYEAHIPYAINKHQYPKAVFEYNYGFEDGFCGNTLYFNTIGFVGEQIKENVLARIEKKLDTLNEVELACEGKQLLNYTTHSFNEAIKLYLQTKFKEKSIYEK